MKSILLGYVYLLGTSLYSINCEAQSTQDHEIKTGADQISAYVNELQNKKVGLLVNHTSFVDQKHLLDTLSILGIDISVIFAPEHGFRGNHGNGQKVNNEIDDKTGIPIISLYGKNKKPTISQLSDVDVIIYDIQDVGVRFYTYISTMHYMMEACATSGTSMIVLDRPNPNGSYIDGPVLKSDFSSFVGLHPIPIVYGMTAGELAMMIQGEKWINEAEKLDLKVIKLKNWTHQTKYNLPISPSPNLPNDQSIALYPSLCLFEGTNISIGRGTPFPFQVIGHPDYVDGNFSFVPKSIEGASKYPKHENVICQGIDLRNVVSKPSIDLSYLIKFYKSSKDPSSFFNTFFSKLAGSNELQNQIEQGLTEEEIKASWTPDLLAFKEMRIKYLIYKE